MDFLDLFKEIAFDFVVFLYWYIISISLISDLMELSKKEWAGWLTGWRVGFQQEHDQKVLCDTFWRLGSLQFRRLGWSYSDLRWSRPGQIGWPEFNQWVFHLQQADLDIFLCGNGRKQEWKQKCGSISLGFCLYDISYHPVGQSKSHGWAQPLRK